MENANSKTLIRLAEKCLSGVLPLKEGLAEIPHTDGHLDWNITFPILGDSVQLLLQSLNSVALLCKAYIISSKTDYLDLAIKIYNDWYQWQKNVQSKSNPFLWNDHAVSCRTEYLIYLLLIYSDCRDEGIISPDNIEDILYNQGKWLNDDKNYFRNCNHGIFEDRALIYLSKLWIGSKGTDLWLKNAKKRLDEQINFAFNAENVHTENSPGYHYAVLKLLFSVSGFLRFFNDPYSEKIDERANKTKEFLLWTITPSDSFAEIGDTEKEYAASIFLTPDSPPHDIRNSEKIYFKTGYYFSRSANDDTPFNDTWFMFKSGYQSQVHKHADDLSVLLSTKGYDVLIDSGRYGNMIGDPFVDYLHSALAHNTVIVDENSYSISDTRTKLCGFIETDITNGIRYIRGFNHSYQGVYIDRSIYHFDHTFIIHDEICSESEHVYSQLFHLSEHVKVLNATSSEIVAEIGKSGDKLIIKQLSAVNDVRTYKGIQNNKVFGYHSDKLGEVIPCTTLQFEKQGVSVDFVTIISVVSDDHCLTDYSYSQDNMEIQNYGKHVIYLKRRERYTLDHIVCTYNPAKAAVILEDHSEISAQKYIWEIWDAKWGKKIRTRETALPRCEFKRDFFVNAYVRVMAQTEYNQIVQGFTSFLQYQSDEKTFIPRYSFKELKLEINGPTMEWINPDEIQCMIHHKYLLPGKIIWHIYRNGGHFYYELLKKDQLFRFKFTQSGDYTIMFFFEEMDGNRYFGNFPQVHVHVEGSNEVQI